MNNMSVAVFCGSQSGADPLFEVHAQELGSLLGELKITVIYGGGKKGLMGAIANAAMGKNGKVVGVIPEVLIGWEHQHTGISDLQIVQDMHARKKIMYDLCNAAIILPGGNGTLDELFEMLTWNTLKIHNKKIFLLNTSGFYNTLIAHMEQMQKSNFLYEPWNERLIICSSPAEIISLLD